MQTDKLDLTFRTDLTDVHVQLVMLMREFNHRDGSWVLRSLTTGLARAELALEEALELELR